MSQLGRNSTILTLATMAIAANPCAATAADVLLRLLPDRSAAVTMVGAVQRWDGDGNPRREVNPQARIDQPEVDAIGARQSDGSWILRQLAPGRYDLILLTNERFRIDGFHYPPVLEFDQPWPSTMALASETAALIRQDIAHSRHYENRVSPLFLGGDDKQARVLVQLLRDQPTSFDAQYGEPIATIRHEFWQYSNRYGGWVKEKRTKVVNRLLVPKRELQQWSWLWEPKLGGIEVTKTDVSIDYNVPPKPAALATGSSTRE